MAKFLKAGKVGTYYLQFFWISAKNHTIVVLNIQAING